MRAPVQHRWRRAILCGVVAAAGGACPAREHGPVPARSRRRPARSSVKAPQAVLMDAESGAVMFQRNGDELMYPASMSKLMLLAVVFKALKAGEVKLEDEFFMSEYAWRKGGAPSGTSAMFVPVGTKATLDELLKGIDRAVRQRRRHLHRREHGRQRGPLRPAHDRGGAPARPQEVGVQERDRPAPSRAPDDGARARHAGAAHHQDLSRLLPAVRA